MQGTGEAERVPVSIFLRKKGEERRLSMKANENGVPCNEIIVLKEKVAALEAWRTSTQADLKEIQDVISQVKLLMALSIGGGGLSVLTLAVTLVMLVEGKR
jgi:hypothetical protein